MSVLYTVIIISVMLLLYNAYIDCIHSSIQPFKNKYDKAICLICRYPNKIWMDFLHAFKHYKVYVVVDDQSDISNYKSQYPKITFVQMNSDECREHGFINMNYLMKKDVTGWEKALYYFSNQSTYNYVWFLEDDVFFKKEKDLVNIDKKHNNSDLLTANDIIYHNDGKEWHWDKIHINHPPPYYGVMVCAARISRNLLVEIGNYAKKNNTLYFLEALFPTEAAFHNLKHDYPPELTTITWNKQHTTFKNGFIYHPVKDIFMHKELRTVL